MTNPVTPLKLLAIAVASALSTVATGQDVHQIEEIAVIGQFVPDEKRGTSSVANVVGTEPVSYTHLTLPTILRV